MCERWVKATNLMTGRPVWINMANAMSIDRLPMERSRPGRTEIVVGHAAIGALGEPMHSKLYVAEGVDHFLPPGSKDGQPDTRKIRPPVRRAPIGLGRRPLVKPEQRR